MWISSVVDIFPHLNDKMGYIKYFIMEIVSLKCTELYHSSQSWETHAHNYFLYNITLPENDILKFFALSVIAMLYWSQLKCFIFKFTKLLKKVISKFSLIRRMFCRSVRKFAKSIYFVIIITKEIFLNYCINYSEFMIWLHNFEVEYMYL